MWSFSQGVDLTLGFISLSGAIRSRMSFEVVLNISTNLVGFWSRVVVVRGAEHWNISANLGAVEELIMRERRGAGGTRVGGGRGRSKVMAL